MRARQVFSMTRGGVSKASKGINLSEDIFAGFNHLLRGGTIPYVEYVQVGPSPPPPQQHAAITVTGRRRHRRHRDGRWARGATWACSRSTSSRQSLRRATPSSA